MWVDSLQVPIFFQILLSSIYFMGEDTFVPALFHLTRVPFAEIFQFAVWSSSSVGFSIYFLIFSFLQIPVRNLRSSFLPWWRTHPELVFIQSDSEISAMIHRSHIYIPAPQACEESPTTLYVLSNRSPPPSSPHQQIRQRVFFDRKEDI